MIRHVAEKSRQDHFASAALRHFRDGEYLQQDGRLPSADHLYGFAAECVSKSLMLRFTEVSVGPKEGETRPSAKPWMKHPDKEDKTVDFGHVNELVKEMRLLARGRGGAQLVAALDVHLRAFRAWRVHDRYSDGGSLTEPLVCRRRDAARNLVVLHDHAVLRKRLS